MSTFHIFFFYLLLGGSIQRVNLETGEIKTLYTHAKDVPLRGPNDIVFDKSGGFWFTDHGKTLPRSRDRTGVFYAKIDGSYIEEAIFPLEAPNGIGLSPDEKTLYVAETPTGRVYKWDVISPGKLKSKRPVLLARGIGGEDMFDSLAIDGKGNVCVATLGKESGITIISPDRNQVTKVETGDPMTTNICFGYGQLKNKAFITLSLTGKLVEMDWETEDFFSLLAKCHPRCSGPLAGGCTPAGS